jgi:enolase
MKIEKLYSFEILDSRGTPTIRTVIETGSGQKFYGDAPSGASTGQFEAVEKRDQNNKSRFQGKGVKHVIEEAQSKLFPKLLHQDVKNFKEIEKKVLDLEGTQNKSCYGSNVILSLLIALYRSASYSLGCPLWKLFDEKESSQGKYLPIPFINVLNGGCHASNNLDIQEFMIVPKGFETFSEAIQASVEIFWVLKKQLKDQNFLFGVGDEGGFAPPFSTTHEALDCLIRAIEGAGYEVGSQVGLALDLAASEFFSSQDQVYDLDGEKLTSQEMISWLKDLVRECPILSLEDPLKEDDWQNWKILTKELPDDVLLVGDDLLVTQASKLSYAIEHSIANAILIKPNQVGSICETLETLDLAKKKNYQTILSHRSGETEDSFIADLAFGVQTPFIKMGSVCRSERTSKYNRLLELEAQSHLSLYQLNKHS